MISRKPGQEAFIRNRIGFPLSLPLRGLWIWICPGHKISVENRLTLHHVIIHILIQAQHDAGALDIAHEPDKGFSRQGKSAIPGGNSYSQLAPLGYQVVAMDVAKDAISKAITETPDLILIANFDLSGLSGKDRLVAYSIQGIMTPVILLGEEGLEEESIRTFYLGTVDIFSLPLLEAKTVSVVERAIPRNQAAAFVPAQRTPEKICFLEDRIKVLPKVIQVVKALTSSQDPQQIFKKAVDSSLHFPDADRGWLKLREYHKPISILRYHQNLPRFIAIVVANPGTTA